MVDVVDGLVAGLLSGGVGLVMGLGAMLYFKKRLKMWLFEAENEYIAMQLKTLKENPDSFVQFFRPLLAKMIGSMTESPGPNPMRGIPKWLQFAMPFVQQFLGNRLKAPEQEQEQKAFG